MTAAPFMQLWVADYIGDTTHLTTEQHGAYLLLLMAMWRAGGTLPDDAAELARIARLSQLRWRRVAGPVLKFFDRADGTISQKRLTKEIARAVTRQRAAVVAGQASLAGRRTTASAQDATQNDRIPIPDLAEETAESLGFVPSDVAIPLARPGSHQSQNQKPETKKRNARAVARSAGDEDAAAVADADLHAMLLDAAGAAVERRAPRISVLSEPLAWLAAGCDLSRDVVPTIAALSHLRPPGSVRSWSYFTDAVVEARDRRTAPHLPKPAKKRSRNEQRSAHDTIAAGMVRALGAPGDDAGGGGGGAAGGDDSVGRGPDAAAGRGGKASRRAGPGIG